MPLLSNLLKLLLLSVIPFLCNNNPYTTLFNGKDLEGWKVHGTERWFVEEGLLICESGPDKEYGYLVSNSTFGNFDLSLSFLQESDGNSGVFFKSSCEGRKIQGWQAEVAPPGLHSGGIYESYGRGWLIKPDVKYDDVVKMGEWNHMSIMANGDLVTTWINGRKMIELQDEKIGKTKGSIALQIHSGGGIRIKWKDIKIIEL